MKKSSRLPWEHDGETLIFETPEQTRLEWRIAPLGSRLVAALLDRLLIALGMVLLLTLVIIAVVFLGTFNRSSVFLYLLAVILIFWFLFTLFYFVWGEVRGEGQTWGKRKLHLRTVIATGQGITLGASLVRNLARLLDDNPLLWIVPALTHGNRRVGDFLAGTLVVLDEADPLDGETKRDYQRLANTYRELTDRHFYFSAQVIARLFRDDLNLLEHLEERLRTTSPLNRQKTIEAVALRYVARLDLQAEAEQVRKEPYRFLQEMALMLRDRFEGEAY